MMMVAACSVQSPSSLVTPTEIPQQSPTPSYTQTPTPTSLPPTPTITPSPTRVTASSPLQGITIPQLTEIVTNPLITPAPGLDDGHHGIDFSYYRRGESIGITGLPVQAVLGGRVSAALTDTWPYGNVIIIESTLAEIPPQWVSLLNLGLPITAIQPDNRLTCPAFDASPYTQSTQKSLYILYAHLLNPPQSSPGNWISSGEILGAVGNTGFSGNPHLHLEFRVGPSDVQFDQMAHYINTATQKEMVNYCLWRVSGVFQIIDPLLLLNARP